MGGAADPPLDENEGSSHCERSEQSRAAQYTPHRDCFVASLLAMTRSSFLLVAHRPGGRPALDETRGAVIASAANQSRTAQHTPRRRLLRRFAPRNDEARFLVSRKTKPAYFCDCDANGAGLRPHREPPCPPRRPRLGRREPRELDPAPQPRQDRANELSADALLGG